MYDIQFLKIPISPPQPIRPNDQIAKIGVMINAEVRLNLIWYITITLYLSYKKPFKTSIK